MTSVRTKTWVGAITLLIGAAGACSSHVIAGGSETNWMGQCANDGDCSVGHCVCGVCSEACERDDACPTGLDTCSGRTSVAFGRFCGSSAGAPSGICTKACGNDAPCASGFTCNTGVCVPAPKGDDAGAGGDDAGPVPAGGGGTGGGPRSSGGGASPVGGPLQTSPTTTTYVDRVSYMDVSGEMLQGKCLPRQLPVDSDGSVACTLVVVKSPASACNCDEPGFRPPPITLVGPIVQRMHEYGECGADGEPPCNNFCFCEFEQALGRDQAICQSSTAAPTQAEWCYVDPSVGAGDQQLVDKCPATEQRMLRLVGLTGTGSVYIACDVTTQNPVDTTDTTQNPVDTTVTPGEIGDPCTPADEANPRFSGFAETEINVETQSPACNTGVCLVANFRGRVSCPYGQADNGMVDANGVPEVDPAVQHRCMSPGPNPVLVEVPVRPQLISRPPEKAVYC
jgi:hypothetical protein